MLCIKQNNNNSVHVFKNKGEPFPETITHEDIDYVYGTEIAATEDVAVYFKRSWLYN